MLVVIIVVTSLVILLFLLNRPDTPVPPPVKKEESHFGPREEIPKFGDGSPFDPRDASAVIVKYRRNVTDLEKGFRAIGLNDVHVVDKGRGINLGTEALAYIEYIVEHYDDLPTHVVLVHDEEYSWHHEGSLVDRVAEHVGAYVELVTLNNLFWGSEIHAQPGNKNRESIGDMHATCLVPDGMRPLRDYGDFNKGMGCCAQFIIHRDVIRRRSLGAYRCLRDWILRTSKDTKDRHPGFVFEYSWYLLWDRIKVRDYCTR